MKKVMIFIVGIFLTFLMLNLVSAERIEFNYTAASNGQVPVNEQYNFTIPQRVFQINTSLRSPGYSGDQFGCYDAQGFNSDEWMNSFRKQVINVIPGDNYSISINPQRTSFSGNFIALQCIKNDTPVTGAVSPVPAGYSWYAAQVTSSLERLCFEAGYDYYISETSQSWNGGCGGKAGQIYKMLWDGTQWVYSGPCTGNNQGYLTGVTCGKYGVNGTVLIDYGIVPDQGAVCGNGQCEAGENEASCLVDCYTRPLGFNLLKWKNYSSNLDITVSKVRENVTLYAESNFSVGTVVSFEIYEEDFFFRDPIKTGDNKLVGIVNGSGVAKINWTISQQDMDNGGDPFDNYLDFYYEASVSGNYLKRSGILQVAKTNDPIIIRPNECDVQIMAGGNKLNNRGIYFVNKNIEFNHTRSQDNLNVQWIIEDDNGARTIRNEKSFFYNFSAVGQKNIILRVSGILGCSEQNRELSIIVINETSNMLVYISAPKHNEVVRFNSANEVNVNYRGNESYVVQSSGTGCAKTLTCLAGNCPLFTSNTPEGCPGNSIGVTPLSAQDKLANLRFAWSKINRGIESPLKSGNGSDNSTGSINYARSSKSSNIGDKQVKLILNYTGSGISLQNKFVRNFTVGTCVNGGRQRVNIDNSGRIINVSNTLTDRNACNDIGEGQCCPIGFTCRSGLCEDTGSLITSCSGYTDEDACENDPFSASEFEYNTKVQAGLPGECNVNYRCEWRGNACAFNITQMDNLGNFGGSCLETAVDVEADACQNGEATKIVRITSVNTGGLLSCLVCQNGEYEVPCGRPSVELPFFGVWQLILSLVCVAGLYLVMFRRNISY